MSRNNTEKKNNIFGRMKVTAALLALNIFMFVILGPTEVFYANYSDFDFEFKDFIFMFLGIGALLWILGSVVISVLPDKINKFINALIFAFGLSFYFQNMLLNPKLMGTVGNAMDWASLKGVTISNTIIWIIMFICYFAIAFFEKEKRDKICIYTSIFLILVQIVAFSSLVYKLQGDEYKSSHYKLSPVGEYELAKDENVIILLLDATSERFFEEEVKKSPEILDGLEDFTYYNNANSKYNYTFPAIPYMLTLEDPDCTITTNEYKKRAWTEGKSKEIHDKLNENGYSYNLYTGSGRAVYLDASYLKGSIDNVEEASNISYKLDYGEMFYLFAKTSLYKYAPYIVKPYLEVQSFYFDGITSFEGVSACIESNASYYEVLCNKGLSIDDSMEKAVIITHLSGVHTPFDINEKGEKVPESETDIKKVRLGINLMLEKYFDELKRLDLYDSSTIIITADHGQYKDALDPQPIYLIKPAGQVMDKMGYNKAPISSEDFIPTIIYLAGQDASVYGTSIFEIFEDEERERKCCFPGKGFEVYTYTGDKEVLRNEIENGKYTRIDATEDWD